MSRFVNKCMLADTLKAAGMDDEDLGATGTDQQFTHLRAVCIPASRVLDLEHAGHKDNISFYQVGWVCVCVCVGG